MKYLVQLMNEKKEELYPKIAEKILYNNEKGSTGNITISEDSANFKYIEIFFNSNTNLEKSLKIYNPNGKNIMLNIIDDNGFNDGKMWLKFSKYVISNKSINFLSGCWRCLNDGVHGNENTFFIKRVIGYK